MSEVPYYTDEQIQRAVVRGLGQRGINVLSVAEANKSDATDEDKWRSRVPGVEWYLPTMTILCVWPRRVRLVRKRPAPIPRYVVAATGLRSRHRGIA